MVPESSFTYIKVYDMTLSWLLLMIILVRRLTLIHGDLMLVDL